MSDIRNIVILTGAGISAESGLETFRASDGLWANHRVEDICTPEALARNRPLVLDFYDQRRAALGTVKPNAAHEALARLDREWQGGLLLVTQNVDDLHERAGSKRLLHMHGELMSALCQDCGARASFGGAMLDGTECGACGGVDVIRPDIVFFGEMPYEMDLIERELRKADLFLSIGTSGAVYPAAGYVRSARHYGARTIELNLEPSGGSHFFDESRLGPASKLVPEWVDEVLGAQSTQSRPISR